MIRPRWARTVAGAALPLLAVFAALMILWYGAAVGLNQAQVRERFGEDAGWRAIVAGSWSMERPVLPAPHQIAMELKQGIFDHPVTSPRSLVYHAWVTLSAALAGLAIALALGMLLAIGIVHLRLLDRSMMPWVIASQTVPVLAIAPMVVVVLGNLGITGLIPKAAIAGYLAFFPITVGMVKGLRAPDPLQLDLMRTYDAPGRDVFSKLRWPASLGFLFPSLRVAVALSLVGAIVAELPTGAQAGLGARLLIGSYYGQTVQIWSALILASVLSLLGIAAVTFIENLAARRRGGRL
uniref:ABC transporter permease subunit n=1 Tax=Acidicaldus sp. TaxID=1872105 RepID=A0A8J4HHF1_9PROT